MLQEVETWEEGQEGEMEIVEEAASERWQKEGMEEIELTKELNLPFTSDADNVH